jgi:hypothetical protein
MQAQARNLTRAVSVFRLANSNESKSTRVAECCEAAARPAEVARLPDKAGKTKREAIGAEPAYARTGTDGDWKEF